MKNQPFTVARASQTASRNENVGDLLVWSLGSQHKYIKYALGYPSCSAIQSLCFNRVNSLTELASLQHDVQSFHYSFGVCQCNLSGLSGYEMHTCYAPRWSHGGRQNLHRS